ncbi:MAG: hypothetical protein CMA10_04720 [Euryarchaeota archaeon]|nr:hypothetical protein [Euryarchaeota archaeon]|tara:strand:+ start:9511 stop:9828 length:318 start_codon:yes stop_codon:yes gene_type:complete
MQAKYVAAIAGVLTFALATALRKEDEENGKNRVPWMMAVMTSLWAAVIAFAAVYASKISDDSLNTEPFDAAGARGPRHTFREGFDPPPGGPAMDFVDNPLFTSRR